MDLFYDLDSGKFNQERYDSDEYKNLVEFNECCKRFRDKIYIKEMTYSDFESRLKLIESDGDSDSTLRAEATFSRYELACEK